MIEETPEVSKEETPEEVAARLSTPVEIPVKVKKVKKVKAEKVESASTTETGIYFLDAKDAIERFKLPKDETDLHWDAKMNNPVPQGLIDTLASEGWDPSMPLRVNKEDCITNGRTKMRALPEAVKLAAKLKLPPIRVPFIVIDEDDDKAMRSGVRLNFQVQHIDPITVMHTVDAYFTRGLTEADAAHDMGISTKKALEFYSLRELDKESQKAVQKGEVSVAAALAALHHPANQANKIIKDLAEKGKKVSVTDVKRAASTGGTVGASARPSVKQLQAKVAELEATNITGAKGKLVIDAATAALEAAMDSRKMDKLIAALEKLAHA